MTHIRYKGNDLCIEEVEVASLAKPHGTPAYCYSAKTIADNFHAIRDALETVLPRSRLTVCYAVKANSNIGVLALLNSLGAGADVVSGGEFYRALQAGIPAGSIVYSGVGKSEEELHGAIRRGIMQINVESEHELRMISDIARRSRKKARIAIRVNPDVDAGTHKKITTGTKDNKFGIDIDEAPEFYKLAASLPGIEASGVAVHIGSQLLDLAPYRDAYLRVASLVKTLRWSGHGITVTDLGGGLGVRYKDETPPDLMGYARLVGEIIEPLNTRVIVEPGRSIVASAGLLLSRVINVKKTRHKTFVILDAAMNDLMRPALYEAYHAVLPCVKSSAKKSPCDIVGPICETGDTFLENESMPPLKAGDLVAIMTSGAYGAAMSSNYNTRPLPAEVIVRGKSVRALRARQKLEDIVSGETIPVWWS